MVSGVPATPFWLWAHLPVLGPPSSTRTDPKLYTLLRERRPHRRHVHTYGSGDLETDAPWRKLYTNARAVAQTIYQTPSSSEEGSS